MKILIEMEDYLEMEFRYKNIKVDLLSKLNQISKIDTIRLCVIDRENSNLRKLQITDDLSYSIDPE